MAKLLEDAKWTRDIDLGTNYAEQDFHLKLTDNHIVHKGIWLLHAQPFYAELDFPYLIAEHHIHYNHILYLDDISACLCC